MKTLQCLVNCSIVFWFHVWFPNVVVRFACPWWKHSLVKIIWLKWLCNSIIMWPSVVSLPLQGFIRPVARVGSGDPVRVLRLYTTITLDEVCSIYCWDICTTCHYRSMCYSTCASGPTMLSVCSRLCLVANCLTDQLAECLSSYCTVRCLL